MKKYKFLLMALVFCAFLEIILFVKQKYVEPKQKLKKATAIVDTLSNANELKDGDLIFQSSLSAQSKAIQSATKSIYSHCGLIYKNGTEYVVFEAIQPVKITPLSKWIARGKEGKFVIKRLKNVNEVLTPEVLLKMQSIGNTFLGKNYDLLFDWSDDKIYCSELIWKIYKRATNLDIGKLQLLKDFDLSNELVQQKMKERYGKYIPLNDTVISPVSIFNSDLLVTVKSN